MSSAQPDFYTALYQWYLLHGRHHLPWRNTTDPYHIWVSEVMLQQTQVQTVLDRFYFPFLDRFPNIRALAKADLQEVLKLWQGLGYYNRARNLHHAAQIVADTGLPDNVEELQKLPGIGRNTAHAITAFAGHKPVAVMEANLKRVLCRIYALENPNEKELWHFAAKLLDVKNPFDYNQAMMDLGALICTPESPKCLLCPAATICMGKSNPQAYPAPKHKKALPIRKKNIVLFKDEKGRIAIQPREGRFLHGLWAFPEYEIYDKEIYFNNIKYIINSKSEVGKVMHEYTHFRFEATVYMQDTPSVENGKTIKEIKNLPLSRTELKILKLIDR